MTRERFLKLLVVLIALALILVFISATLMHAGNESKSNDRVKDKIRFGPVELPKPGTSPQVPPAYPKSANIILHPLENACRPMLPTANRASS